MKIGLIVECARKGLEHVVCPRILQLLAQEAGKRVEHDVVPMTNKKLLLLGAAEVAARLLAEGCDRVVVVWDENPPWRPDQDFARDRCWHVEREALIARCDELGLDRQKVRFVCIEREFESWLMFDRDLLCAVLNLERSRRHKCKPPRQPDQSDWPKQEMEKLFRRNGRPYNGSAMAQSFVRHLASLDNLKRCDTFRYFAKLVLGAMPAGWPAFDYVPRRRRR